MASWDLQLAPIDETLKKHLINPNGKGQLFFSQEFLRQCNPYVPFESGDLANKYARVETPTTVAWVRPYARRQYYENTGNGKEGTKRGGRRGSHWAERMWQDRKESIVKAVAKYCGGVAK